MTKGDTTKIFCMFLVAYNLINQKEQLLLIGANNMCIVYSFVILSLLTGILWIELKLKEYNK